MIQSSALRLRLSQFKIFSDTLALRLQRIANGNLRSNLLISSNLILLSVFQEVIPGPLYIRLGKNKWQICYGSKRASMPIYPSVTLTIWQNSTLQIAFNMFNKSNFHQGKVLNLLIFFKIRIFYQPYLIKDFWKGCCGFCAGFCHTLSVIHSESRKTEQVTMKANFMYFWSVESEFVIKNSIFPWTSELAWIWHFLRKLDYFWAL